MSIFSRIHKPVSGEFATSTVATFATHVEGKGSTVASAARVAVADEQKAPPAAADVATVAVANHLDGMPPKPNQAQILPPSTAGNDHPPANQIPVEVHTQAGKTVTVFAADQEQAEWIKAHNKPCQRSKPVAPSELPQVANPGVPSDLHMLATRYCAEAYGDGPEAIAEMLADLLEVPDDWSYWKADFIRKLSIPDQARCCDCQHSEFVHGGLGRCLRGIQSPGAAGWWLTDQHHCLGFTARLQPQIPECPGISGWRFATNNEELK